MKNKAIIGSSLATNDSLKSLKKLLGSTALATTLVATSFFTGLTPSANAADVTVGANATVTAGDENGDGTANDPLQVSDQLQIGNGNVTIATASALIDVAEIDSVIGNSIITLTGTGHTAGSAAANQVKADLDVTKATFALGYAF